MYLLFFYYLNKINKPDLPLASGDFSIKTGVAITLTCAMMVRKCLTIATNCIYQEEDVLVIQNFVFI